MNSGGVSSRGGVSSWAVDSDAGCLLLPAVTDASGVRADSGAAGALYAVVHVGTV